MTNDEVITVLTNLNNNKAHGPDGIPARWLTETSSQIAPSLCALFNKSLRCGVLPDDWKLAPVHKRGQNSNVENDRPISLLSLISKGLERCVSITSNIMFFNKSTVVNTVLFHESHA